MSLPPRGVTCCCVLADRDVLIESFTPEYLDNLGLGYATLHEVNPRLIVVSITPLGRPAVSALSE